MFMPPTSLHFIIFDWIYYVWKLCINCFINIFQTNTWELPAAHEPSWTKFPTQSNEQPLSCLVGTGTLFEPLNSCLIQGWQQWPEVGRGRYMYASHNIKYTFPRWIVLLIAVLWISLEKWNIFIFICKHEQ